MYLLLFAFKMPHLLVGLTLLGSRHKAERPVLQLTELPKKPKRPWRKVRSHPKVVGFDSSLHHTPGVFPNAKPSLPNIGGPRFPIVAFVRMPWAVVEEACPSLRGCLFRPLAEAILLPVPTFETGFGVSFFTLRIPKQPKLWSSSSTRRSHEDIFFRLQSASPGIHPALG